MAQGLGFRLNDEGRKLIGWCDPAGDRPALTNSICKESIEAAGFSQLFISEMALIEFVNRYTSATKPFEMEIGEVRDGAFAVSVDPDNMAAYLTVVPPYGGKPVTKAQILDTLNQRGVIYGVLTGNIEAVIEYNITEKTLIAEGLEPIKGQDGYVQSMLPQIKDRTPRVNDDGKVDYRDLGEIFTVQANQSLMKIVPPTPGEPGYNVLGKLIPPTPGKAVQWGGNLSGTNPNPENPNELLAAISGQPVLVPNGVIVEPTYEVQEVSVATGNVNFDGTVRIHGDVYAGMTVKSSADIYIDGMVETAILRANGDIVIKGGIIGHGDASKSSGMNAPVDVSCGGNISARFIQNARVEAGDSIFVDDVVVLSSLIARNSVIVGKEGSSKGKLVGGITRAGQLIRTSELGAPSNVLTKVEVGVDPSLQREMAKINHDMNQKLKELDDVQKILHLLRANPERAKPGLKEKAEKTFEALKNIIAQLTEDKNQLQQRYEVSLDAQVKAARQVYGGAEITIGGKVYTVGEERRGCTFYLKGNAIAYK